MKYVSIDIETTGLDENYCQILSVGAIIEDTKNKLPFEEIPKFHAVIVRDRIQGEPFALNLNRDLIELVNEYYTSKEKDTDLIFINENYLAKSLNDFFIRNSLSGKITVAGKNYQDFDKKFLDKVPHWNALDIHRRVIDPATSFVDWENDNELPNLNLCKQRAGLEGIVTHNAIEDAWDVIQLLRTKY